jgi:hypothetical protein
VGLEKDVVVGMEVVCMDTDVIKEISFGAEILSNDWFYFEEVGIGCYGHFGDGIGNGQGTADGDFGDFSIGVYNGAGYGDGKKRAQLTEEEMEMVDILIWNGYTVDSIGDGCGNASGYTCFRGSGDGEGCLLISGN